MTWFTASLITYIKKNGEPQEAFPVFEDFVLIEAADEEEALSKAVKIGCEAAALDDALEYCGAPASRVFAGVRKLRSIYNPASMDLDESRPVSGTELSHSYFEASSEADALALGKGLRVSVSYLDDSNE